MHINMLLQMYNIIYNLTQPFKILCAKSSLFVAAQIKSNFQSHNTEHQREKEMTFYPFIKVHSRTYHNRIFPRCPSMFFDVPRCFLMFLDVLRCFLMFIDVPRCLDVLAGKSEEAATSPKLRTSMEIDIIGPLVSYYFILSIQITSG